MSSNPNPAFIVLFVVAIVLSCPFVTCTGWFFYDGAVTYPNQRRRALEFERIQHEYPNRWQGEWIDTAKAKGWPTDNPGPAKSEFDILTQYILGSICSVLSLTMAIVVVVFGILIRRKAKKEAAET